MSEASFPSSPSLSLNTQRLSTSQPPHPRRETDNTPDASPASSGRPGWPGTYVEWFNISLTTKGQRSAGFPSHVLGVCNPACRSRGLREQRGNTTNPSITSTDERLHVCVRRDGGCLKVTPVFEKGISGVAPRGLNPATGGADRLRVCGSCCKAIGSLFGLLEGFHAGIGVTRHAQWFNEERRSSRHFFDVKVHAELGRWYEPTRGSVALHTHTCRGLFCPVQCRLSRARNWPSARSGGIWSLGVLDIVAMRLSRGVVLDRK